MELKISRQELAKGLSLVQGVVEKKSTMPILSNTLFEATDSGLKLTATDLEVGVVNDLAAEVLEGGRVALPARGIYDIVRELSADTVHLKVDDGNRVTITCGSAEFKIMGLPANEFPALPKKGEGSEANVSATTLMQMIGKTAFAMSSDETRYALNGVYLEQTAGKNKTILRMVATDGHRLSISEREIAKGWNLKKGVIVPRKGVAELKKLLDTAAAEEGEGAISLWIDDKHAVAQHGNVTLIIRLIDGQFPPYSQVVPKTTKREIKIDREVIYQALKRVSVVTSGQTRGVKLSISPKNVAISSSNPDFGEAHEELGADYRGDSFEVGFNARYFLDVLGILEDKDALLKMGDDTAPCLITSEMDPGFTHIIMPMRL